MKLTPVQERVLEAIRASMREGTSPTLGEIASACGKSTGTVQTALRALQTKGYIEIQPRKSRGIRLANPDTPAARLAPVLEDGAFLRSADIVAEGAGMEAGHLWIRDGRRFVSCGRSDTFEFRDEIPIKLQGLLRIVSEREPEFEGLIDPRARSFLLIPVLDEGRLAAVLALYSSQPLPKGAREFAAEAASLLAAPARVAAIRMKSSEDLRLHETMLGIVEALDFTQVLETIQERMPADSMWIARRAEKGWTAVFDTDLDNQDRRVCFPERPMKHTKTLARLERERYVLLNRTPQELGILEGTPGEPHWAMGNPARRSASLLYAPIRFGGEWTGAISVHSYRMNAYRHEDAERLLIVARYLGLAFRLA